MKIKKKFSVGFTLIELMVAIGVTTLLLPILFSLFFITIQSQAKVLILQEVKRNGDFALNNFEYLVKNRAVTIYADEAKTTEVCTTVSGLTTPSSSNTVYFADSNGDLFYFAINGEKIASYSAVISPNPANLTNSKVVVSGFTISCKRNSTFTPPVVSISFSITNPAAATRHEEKALLNYQTKIKLRSY